MIRKFKTDRNYLLRYCLINILFFGVATGFLLNLREIGSASILPWDYAYLLIAVLLCGLPSSLMHNCAHDNLGPKWLNRLIGETIGAFMLYGFTPFKLGHFYHHRFPDNPEYDVHPPRGYGFLRFVLSPTEQTITVLENLYFENFGYSNIARQNAKLQKVMFGISIVVKLGFWFCLFGPKLFLMLYLPTYVLNIFVFAHINYATHVETDSGGSEVIDLDHNVYYKFVNLVSFGGYYHKNHHLNPGMINPSLKRSERKKLLTWSPSKGSTPPLGRPPLWSLRKIPDS